MLEKDVKDRVKDIVLAAGKLVPLYTMCPMTFGYGESGHPDRLLYINGYLLGIECKKNGNTSLLRPELKATSSERAQKHRLREITAAGGISIVVHSGNLKQFKALIEEIIDHKILVKV